MHRKKLIKSKAKKGIEISCAIFRGLLPYLQSEIVEYNGNLMNKIILSALLVCGLYLQSFAQDSRILHTTTIINADSYTTFVDTSLSGYFIDFSADEYVNGVLHQSKEWKFPTEKRQLSKGYLSFKEIHVDSMRRHVTFVWNDARKKGAGTITITEKLSHVPSFSYRVDTNIYGLCVTIVFDSTNHPVSDFLCPVIARCFIAKGGTIPIIKARATISEIIQMFSKVVVIYWQKFPLPVDDGNDMIYTGSVKVSNFYNTGNVFRSNKSGNIYLNSTRLNIIAETYDSGILTETKNTAKMIAQDSQINIPDMSLPYEDTSNWELDVQWRVSPKDTCTFALSQLAKHCFTLNYSLNTSLLDSFGILSPHSRSSDLRSNDKVPFNVICFSGKNEPLAPSNDSEAIERIVKKYAKAIVIYYQRDTTSLQTRNDMMAIDIPHSTCAQFIYTSLKPTVNPVSTNYIIEFYDGDSLSETIDIAKLLK